MYVAWLPVLPGDARPEVADLVVDRRATHYWDGERKLERFVGRTLGFADGTTAYDVFLVYGPDAKWGDPPKASGAPVVSGGAALERALAPYLRDA